MKITVYLLLVARCGASYRLLQDFVIYMTDGRDLPKEFRFQGNYGFGGKLYRTHDKVYVSCYPEDSTPEIEISIDSVNRQLEAIAEIRRVLTPKSEERKI